MSGMCLVGNLRCPGTLSWLQMSEDARRGGLEGSGSRQMV